MTTIDSITEQIRAITYRCWSIEKTVCKGPERDRLREELNALYQEKKELTAQRSQLQREKNAQAVSAMGGGTFTTETRSPEQIKQDAEDRSKRQRERFQQDLNALAGVLKPTRIY